MRLTSSRLRMAATAVAGIVLGGYLSAGETGPKGTTAVNNLYVGLRQQALQSSRASLELPEPSSVTEPWGVLMETGYEQATITVLALADGNASIYFSTGGGFIGGQRHESIRRAAVAMVREASRHVQVMKEVKSFPLPENGNTVFYLLTDSGVFSASAGEQALGEGGHDLSALFYAGQDVITQFRVLEEKK